MKTVRRLEDIHTTTLYYCRCPECGEMHSTLIDLSIKRIEKCSICGKEFELVD